MSNNTPGYRPYGQMVQRLFKTMGSPEGSMMHAAIGMAGEAAELLSSTSFNNVMEEMGDYEFYNEALRQLMGVSRELIQGHAPLERLTFANVVPLLVQYSGDALDAVKKAWVYNKPLDGPSLAEKLGQIECCLWFLRSFIGVTYGQVQQANRDKLAKRYPEGVYSDSAAQARADKAADE